MSLPVAVVGAGVYGLTLAHALRRAGQPVVLLEAQARAGGVLHSAWEEGLLLEWGANGFLDREGAVGRLAAQLGVADKVRPGAPASRRRFLFTRGALRELPAAPPAFLASDVLTLPGRLRMLLEPFSGRGPREGEESLADFGRRHVGREATAVLLDAVQTGTWAGDIERLSVQAAYPRFAELERAHRSLLLGMVRSRKQARAALPAGVEAPAAAGLASFEGGMQTLVDALVASVGEALRLSSPVRALARTATGWRLEVEGGPAVEAQRVVLATPAYAAAELLRPQEAALAEALEAIPYAPISVVHLGYDTAGLPPVDGFGFLVPAREGRGVLGCIYASRSFPFRAREGRTLLTVLVGGRRRPELAALPDALLLTQVREELAAILGVRAEPLLTRIVRWPRGIPQYELGHLARLERVRTLLPPGIVLGGNAYEGVGVADCVRNALARAEGLLSA